MPVKEVVYDEVDPELAMAEKDVPRPLPEANDDSRVVSGALADED